jgi:hypothetical protein
MPKRGHLKTVEGIKAADKTRKLASKEKMEERVRNFPSILFVIPSRSTWTFEVEDSYMSMKAEFGKWLKDTVPNLMFRDRKKSAYSITGDSCPGILQLNDGKKCAAFHHDWNWEEDEPEDDGTSTTKMANFSSPSLFLIYKIAKKLEINLVEQIGLICSMHFEILTRKSSLAFAQDIADEGYNFVFLCGEAQWVSEECSVTQQPLAKYEHVAKFCSIDLVRYGIKSYPPPELIWFFLEKQRRDKLLEKVMAPHFMARLPATNDFSKMAKQAIGHFSKEYEIPEDSHSSLIVKLTSGSGMDGVFVLKAPTSADNIWDGSSIRKYGCCKVGVNVRIEPFYRSLRKKELRIFAVREGDSKVRILYYVETCVKEEMEIARWAKRSRPAEYFGTKNLGGGDYQKVMACIKQTFRILADGGGFTFGNMRNLVLRFDIYSDGNHYFLNELDIFPFAYSFFQSTSEEDDVIDLLAQTVASYLKEKVQSNIAL